MSKGNPVAEVIAGGFVAQVPCAVAKEDPWRRPHNCGRPNSESTRTAASLLTPAGEGACRFGSGQRTAENIAYGGVGEDEPGPDCDPGGVIDRAHQHSVEHREFVQRGTDESVPFAQQPPVEGIWFEGGAGQTRARQLGVIIGVHRPRAIGHSGSGLEDGYRFGAEVEESRPQARG